MSFWSVKVSISQSGQVVKEFTIPTSCTYAQAQQLEGDGWSMLTKTEMQVMGAALKARDDCKLSRTGADADRIWTTTAGNQSGTMTCISLGGDQDPISWPEVSATTSCKVLLVKET
jgi:hypothetical protein